LATRPPEVATVRAPRAKKPAVRISPEGATEVDNGAEGVLFAAGQTLAPWRLCEPRDPFTTCRLFAGTHAQAAHGAELARIWLFSFPTNPRSKPPLCLAGPVGSGKTRTAKGFAELYGLPFVASKVEESLEANFWPSVDRGGLFILDNADTRTRWLADSLAAAATDGCASRRRLYTDNELITLRANAWLVVTSANPTFGADSGLADRLLLVRMDRREGEATSDAELGDEILANRDAGLSFIAQTLAGALADNAPTPEGVNLRHPDFAAFAVRIGRALEREGEAVAALRAAEFDKSAFCLENDSIGSALVALVDSTGGFEGTAAELLPRLGEIDPELNEQFSPKRLAKRLVALWPHLVKQFAKACKEPDRKSVLVFRFQSRMPVLPVFES